MFQNAVETLTMNCLGRCHMSYMFLHKYYWFDKCENYAENINFSFIVDMVGHAQKRSWNFHDVMMTWLGHTCISTSTCTINLINANIMQETSNMLKKAVETFMT